MLGRILETLREAREPLSLRKLSHRLAVQESALEGMIEFLVRKGRLRVAGECEDCGSCGRQGGCPFVIAQPKSYVVVEDPA